MSDARQPSTNKTFWLVLGGIVLVAVYLGLSKKELQPVIRVAHIISPEVGIWSKPDDASRLVGHLRQHDTIAITSILPLGWAAVRFGHDRDESGFVQMDALTPAKYAHPLFVKEKHPVPIMANPDDNQQTVVQLHNGDSVGYLDSSFPGWARVYLHNGTTGFMHEYYLKDKVRIATHSAKH